MHSGNAIRTEARHHPASVNRVEYFLHGQYALAGYNHRTVQVARSTQNTGVGLLDYPTARECEYQHG